MAVTVSAALPNASRSLGALEIGVLVMAVFFGIVTFQTYNYYHRYPGDSLSLKVFVAVVWLLDVGHAVSVAAVLYDVTVEQFGKLSDEILDPMPTSVSTAILFSAALAALVQGFFAYRVHVLSKRVYLPLIYWLGSFVRLVGSIAVASLSIIEGLSLQAYGEKHGWLISSIFIEGAFVDLAIAAGMCYYLKRERALAIPRTVKSLDRLIVYSIETGVVTSMNAVAIIICFTAMPDNLVWFGVYMFFGEMFANAFMASLNSRRERSETDDTVISTFRAPYVGNAAGPEPLQPYYLRQPFKRNTTHGRTEKQKTVSTSPYGSSDSTFPRATLTSDSIIEIPGATDANEDFSIAPSNDEGKHSGTVALPLPKVD